MAHCWEEYLWKVHKAVPVDPWASSVALLDVMIAERPPSLWLPPWLSKRKLQLPHGLSRAGSMLTLASDHSCKPQVVKTNIASADDGIGADYEVPVQQLDSHVAGDASMVLQAENNNNRGSTHHRPSKINTTNSGSADMRQLQVTDSNIGLSTHSMHILTDETTTGSLVPHISNANDDATHPVQLIKSRSVNQVLNKSRTHTGSTTSPMHAPINNTIDRKSSRSQVNHVRKFSQTSAELMLKNVAMRTSRLPDIQASIKSSTSFLASITGGSSASAQFDVKGSKTVTCNVGGVISRSVDLDALMELVTPRMTFDHYFMAPWQPDISLPQLQECHKRGKTLWVVIEILYANVIKIEGDNEAQTTNKAKVVKGVAGVEISEQVGVDKEGVWKVTATKDNPSFAFALRLQRLKYDANGVLVTSNNKYLKRNTSHSVQNHQGSSPFQSYAA